MENKSFEKHSADFTYQLLGRLKSDCDYCLGAGSSTRHLWGKTIDDHIAAMRFYWNDLKVKPDWLSMQDIDDYEKKLKAKYHESIQQEAARHLVKIEVFFDGKNAFSFNYEGNVYVFRGDANQLARFLQSIKAKDNNTQPRSVRGERYADIAQEIIDKTDNIIYAWSNDLSNAINKRKEEVEKTTEGLDDIILSSKTFISSGLFKRVEVTYNKTWAEALATFADDPKAHKLNFYLISDVSYSILEICKLTNQRRNVLFFKDKNGVSEGEDIILLPNSRFSNAFASSKKITFIGIEDSHLVIKSGSDYFHTIEKLVLPKNIKNPNIYVFSNDDVQKIFINLLKKHNVKFEIKDNKVFTDPDEEFEHIHDFADFYSKYSGDGYLSYSYGEYSFLTSRGEIIESVKEYSNGDIVVSNEDHALLSDLFVQLNKKGWKVFNNIYKAIRSNGNYIQVKGNFIEVFTADVYINVPYVKDTTFEIKEDGTLTIELGKSNVIKGIITV